MSPSTGVFPNQAQQVTGMLILMATESSFAHQLVGEQTIPSSIQTGVNSIPQ